MEQKDSNNSNTELTTQPAKNEIQPVKKQPPTAKQTVAKVAVKVAVKNPYILPIIGSLSLVVILVFTIFVSALTVLGFFDGDSSGSGSSGAVAYESECNYEETKVTVMDGNNKVVLATQSLEDYILGVLCPEIGACSGQVASKEEHYIKTKIVAARTYVLARGGYNSSSKSITIRASTRDQQWCDVDSGCKVTKTDDLIPGYSNQYFYNTYPGDYLPVDGSVTQTYSYTEEDLQLLRQYYKDTYGELYLSDSYKSTISRLTSSDATSYKASTQTYWNKQAQAGKNYVEILDSTGTSGVADSEDYVGKSIYKLGAYCKSTNTGSNSSGEASGDVIVQSGGMPIPSYYQNDYKDVVLGDGYAGVKTVSSSGCGFTSVSMIVSYLTDKKITPREFVDDWSRKYYIYNEGMDWSLPAAAAGHYNLGSVTETKDINVVIQKLKEGHPVMSSQAPGLFTRNAHLIVLRGVTSDGKILVNDPNKSNAVDKDYDNRAFTKNEVDSTAKNYWIWPKKT